MEISFKSFESMKFISNIHKQLYYKFYIDPTFILKAITNMEKLSFFMKNIDLIYFILS